MPSPAYRVKHFTFGRYKDDPISDILATRIMGHPYSWTSNKSQAEKIARSKSYIYVVEVGLKGKEREYKLGYCFQANVVKPVIGGKLKYKIVSASTPYGMYLDKPEILSGKLHSWALNGGPGMPSIDSDIIIKLDALFKANGKPF